MFVNKDFILLPELADKLDKRLSYICNSIIGIKNYDNPNIIKMGENTFILKSIAEQIFKNTNISQIEFTDFSRMIPLPYLEKEFKFNKLYCIKKNYGSIKKFYFNTEKNNEKLIEKAFFEFNEEIYKNMKNKVWSHEKIKSLEPGTDFLQVSKLDCIIYWK